MLKRLGIQLFAIAVVLTVAAFFIGKTDAAVKTLQQEGETCTITKSAKLRNPQTGNVITTLSRGTKVYILGGGNQGWMDVRVKRGKKTLQGSVNYLEMKCPSN